MRIDTTDIDARRTRVVRLAKIVFIGAGVWGIVVLTPFYWLLDLTGRRYPQPTDYQQFFYGFLSVALAWQIAFLVIGSNPVRFRPLMIPSMLEKLGYVITVALLYGQARIAAMDAMAAVPDLLLGMLFVVAFAKTRALERRSSESTQPYARQGAAETLLHTNLDI
jgi:hypothetical protein